jgi:hypothetical protein
LTQLAEAGSTTRKRGANAKTRAAVALPTLYLIYITPSYGVAGMYSFTIIEGLYKIKGV